ncbi:MAG: sugar ABC transporter ATP-binding protein [Chloroflexota bacterium]|nr:sugar ABC transporter ATP-binding protein [Chloroflexota bacterium]
MSSVQKPLLQLTGIAKAFPGTKALKGVDFSLRAGEVHALIGENGAGKSTLIKIIAGLYQQDAGTIEVEGKNVEFHSPADSLEHRIKVVYQELDLVPDLSIAENVFLGNLPKKALRAVDWQALYSRTSELLLDLGLDIDPEVPISALTVAQQQLVEIARALSRQAQIIIMDEPTSALSQTEIESLFAVIRRLQGRGVGVMYVSHKLDEIYAIADRVTVFRDGEHIATEAVADTRHKDLVTWMVGREVKDLYPRSPAVRGDVLLEADSLSGGNIENFSLNVHAGEIVAVFGLMGSGVHNLGRLIFGDMPRAGSVRLSGEEIQAQSPMDAIRKGLGFLTENRKSDGLLLPLSVKDNITLVSVNNYANLMVINGQEERRATTDIIKKLSIKTPGIAQRIRYLSGGNQQKSLVGRWLLEDLKVLMFSEPTRGIDVGSKAEIYRLMDDMAHQGMGILVLSTELPEVMGIADRIIIIRQGKSAGRWISREEANEQDLMTAATVQMEKVI